MKKILCHGITVIAIGIYFTSAFTTNVYAGTMYSTMPASDITATSATLNGNAQSTIGLSGELFHWGTDPDKLVNNGAATPQGVAGPVKLEISGLTCNTTYYFKFTGDPKPPRTTLQGETLNFTTAACPDGPFKKDGNNGTVSCNTYCGAAKADEKPVWGDKIGYCVEAKNESTGETVPCDTAPGLIKDGKQLTCLCNPDVKIQHGNNGTISCKAFCERTKETCVAAWNNVTNSNSEATCDYIPGFLNGPELTCTCR
ncbi:hypothetical protein GMJAKD_12435 [Candidatus Electrothrix aarhusensis]